MINSTNSGRNLRIKLIYDIQKKIKEIKFKIMHLQQCQPQTPCKLQTRIFWRWGSVEGG